MGFDPFFAPQSGQGGGGQDPFGGPVPRRPYNQPGGDPFAPRDATQGPPLADGNITPHIEVEIAGDKVTRRKDIKNFTLRTDIQQLYDPFSFTLANPEGEMNWILDELDKRNWIPIRIYHADPFVMSGSPRPWARGVLVRGRIGAGLHGSTADDVAKEVAIYKAHKATPIVVATEGDDRFAAADYVDQTMGTSNDRMIMTRGSTNTFDYPCMTIRAGQSVMFMWTFSRHPLAPGVAPGASGTAPDMTPILPHNTGTLYTVRFPTTGIYPFYCTAHPDAMKGAVMVVP